MKKQPTVLPVCEQTRGPSQLDPYRHSFRLTQYAAELAWGFFPTVLPISEWYAPTRPSSLHTGF